MCGLGHERSEYGLLIRRADTLVICARRLGGLPPGGVLSPFFLITHFDRLRPLLLERRETGNARLREVHWAIFTYADDVVTTQAHEAPTCLVEAVDSEATDVDEGLGELGLSISAPKSNIVTLSPGGIAGS